MPSTTNEKSNGIARAARAPLDRVFDRDVSKDRTLSHGAPVKLFLGALPVMRLIPQDVHSILDYTNGVAVGAGAFLSDDEGARLASIVLGAGIIGVSAVTDYRLSVAKLIPIKAHEMSDYLWGAAAIAAPFALGYWKRSPHVAMMHVMSGVGTILASMITDYRAAKRRR